MGGQERSEGAALSWSERRRGERRFCWLVGVAIMGEQAGKACPHRPGLFMSGRSGDAVRRRRATRRRTNRLGQPRLRFELQSAHE